MIKEDVSLIISALGIYAFFRVSKKAGIITFLVGISWAYFSVGKLIPYIRAATSDGTQETSYGHFRRFAFGESLGDFIKNIFLKPENTLRMLFFLSEEKLATLFLLILPVGLLSVLSVIILVASLEIMLHFLSIFSYQCLLGWQYSAPIVPFAIISSIFGCFLLKRWKITSFSLSVYILVASLLSNYYFGMRVLTPITDQCYNSAVYNPNNHQTIFSVFPEKLKEYYKMERKIRLFETLKKIIPKERTVCVVDNQLAHFSQRKTIFYSFPSYEEADYVVINTCGVDEGWVQIWGSGKEVKKGLDRVVKDQRFQVLFSDGPGGGKIILFGKKGKEYKEEIIKNTKRLVKDNPFSPEAHFILGSIYSYTDNLKMAKKEFEIALKLDPENRDAKQMLEECKKLLRK